ncbi:hypothetical protein [Sphingobacterium sp. BIGb0116]|uniref:hypothetical protein n=1 Tax=Sphingobacterium sp. BIGb0116 TaxID=2940619 RepID=UPI002167E2B3|nr:hypothetical protein [Sphingobacterium sp. BIGb0116]MCS4164768.1 hypothetical protein [Sphingobacterium sp. BIGb0116]
MPNPESYLIYQAYVINVRDLTAAETDIKRLINRSLKSGKEHTVLIQTKVYALIYSTFSEASFSKMVLTPYGFEQGFINQILALDLNLSLQEKWIKCLDLAFIKFSLNKKGSEVPNKKLELSRIIQKFVIEPSIIRNKIAHGQFSQAINRQGNLVNPELTKKILDLSFVGVMRLFKINRLLVSIIEDLIESPDYFHHSNYYSKFQKLCDFIEKSASWTNSSKLLVNNMKRKIPTRI